MGQLETEIVRGLQDQIRMLNRDAAIRHDKYAAALAEGRLERDKLRAELEAAKADTARLDKVERMKIDLLEVREGWKACTLDDYASEPTVRAAIDKVPE